MAEMTQDDRLTRKIVFKNWDEKTEQNTILERFFPENLLIKKMLTVTLRSELVPTLREGTGVPRFQKSHIMH